jgi:hypothetical protein
VDVVVVEVAALESAAVMLVASVRDDAARSGCSDVSGEDGCVEMEEGAGVLSAVVAVLRWAGWRARGRGRVAILGRVSRSTAKLGNWVGSGRQR